VGYAGGVAPQPTYRRLGDQTECFQVDFDPAVISYGQLVDLALASHDPRWRAHKVQYASLILAHDETQLALASDRAARAAARLGGPLATRIERLNHFWIAEDYHQKHHLRNDRVLATEFSSVFGSDEAALRESTAAARANGYAAGAGTKAQLATEIGFLGLSEAGRARLIAWVSDDGPSGSCGFGGA